MSATPSVGRRVLRIAGRIFKWGAIAVVLLLTCLAVYGRVQRSRDVGQWKAPGRIVEVEPGRKMHIDCMGTGAPTVILEAGLGDYSQSSWWTVQPQLSAYTRTCSYDRAGTGWSDAPRVAPMPTAMVDDLHALLAGAGEQGPYVMVGHSLGGPLVRHYSVHYPSDVAGLVLVDGSHEDQIERMNLPGWTNYIYPVFRVLNFFALDRALGGLSAHDSISRKNLALTSTPTAVGNSIAIGESLGAFFAEVKREARDFGDLPITALTAGKMSVPGMSPEAADSMHARWVAMHKEIVGRTTRGQWILAGKSAHYIQKDEPDLVINAVKAMVDSVRAAPVRRP